jgi:hypothetical protein
MSAHVEAKRAWHFAGKRVQKNLHGAHAANVASAVAKMSAEKLKQEKSLLQVVENKGKERRGRMQSEMELYASKWLRNTQARKNAGLETVTEEEIAKFRELQQKYTQNLVKLALKGMSGHSEIEIRKLFDAVDSDGNGVLSAKEVARCGRPHLMRSTACFALSTPLPSER